jgi:hypothetical protein
LEDNYPVDMDVGRSPPQSGEGKVMSQGTRGGLIRTLLAGLGVAVCVSLVGCTELDKPKDKVGAEQPGPGLPGTARLPGQPNSGVGTGQPNAFAGMGNQNSATGLNAGRSPSTLQPAGATNFGTNTNTFVPSVAPNDRYPPINPSSAPPSSGSFGPASSAGAPYSVQPLGPPDVITPPAAPGASGGVVLPPSGPMAPPYQK